MVIASQEFNLVWLLHYNELYGLLKNQIYCVYRKVQRLVNTLFTKGLVVWCASIRKACSVCYIKGFAFQNCIHVIYDRFSIVGGGFRRDFNTLHTETVTYRISCRRRAKRIVNMINDYRKFMIGAKLTRESMAMLYNLWKRQSKSSIHKYNRQNQKVIMRLNLNKSRPGVIGSN